MVPAESFIEVFGARGVEITPQEVRGPVGLEKKDHIRALLDHPGTRQMWACACAAEARLREAGAHHVAAGL
jgi:phosphonoacetaldehyde hydrolase